MKVAPVVTLIDGVVAPPGDHKYPVIVLPAEAVAVAVNVLVGLEQVIVPLGAQLTVGRVVSTGAEHELL